MYVPGIWTTDCVYGTILNQSYQSITMYMYIIFLVHFMLYKSLNGKLYGLFPFMHTNQCLCVTWNLHANLDTRYGIAIVYDWQIFVHVLFLFHTIAIFRGTTKHDTEF